MTTDTIPNFGTYLAYRLAKPRAKKATKPLAEGLLLSLIRVVLHLAGFGFLTYAGFQFNIIAGLVVAGFSCFVFSTLLTSGDSKPPVAPADPMLRR